MYSGYNRKLFYGERGMPKITIVLPTYNGQQYIKESIESIINQTFKDWELIIVNDCSIDNTFMIINEYAKRDSRISIINNEENKKLPQSLNIGFSYARGKYYTWTSDDNLYLPDALWKMNQYLDENLQEVMVCTGYEVINSEGEKLYDSSSYDKSYMYVRNRVGACFLYRSEVVETIGEYNKNSFLVEDYEYWLRILFKYKSIGNINENLYLYRIHDKSLSENRKKDINRQLLIMRKQYIVQIMECIKHRKDYLCELYYEFKHAKMLDEEMIKLFMQYVPEIRIDCETVSTQRAIVYGAGGVGKQVYSMYSNIIDYYADKNKYGMYLCGKEIITLQKMKELSGEYQILVAASEKYIYSFLKTLVEYDIHKCVVLV